MAYGEYAAGTRIHYGIHSIEKVKHNTHKASFVHILDIVPHRSTYVHKYDIQKTSQPQVDCTRQKQCGLSIALTRQELVMK